MDSGVRTVITSARRKTQKTAKIPAQFNLHALAIRRGRQWPSPAVIFMHVSHVKIAMPVGRRVFDFYIQAVKRLFGEDTPWCAAGIGRHQIQVNEWAVSSGGHARAGLEDNVRLDKATLAPSNAALVRRVADLCANYDRRVATPSTARALLGLKAAA